MRVTNHDFVVSLQEPALLVKDYMRKFYSLTAEELRRQPHLAQKIANYNTQTFMGMLTQAIFNTPKGAVGVTDKDLEQAEKLLIWDGMKPQMVVECVRRVFEQCMDILAVSIPYLAFYDESGVEFSMVNEFDLRVTLPVDIEALEATYIDDAYRGA